MAIELSKEEIKLYEETLEFAKKNLAPYAHDNEESGKFPIDVLKQFCSAGYCCINLPEEFGGKNLGFLQSALVYEALAHGDAAFTFAMECHNNISYEIYKFNPHESVKELIPEMVKGNKLTSFALTEPEAGSDPSRCSTYATLEEDGYHINGTKTWATNGLEADLINVMVKDGSPKGMLMLLVDNRSKGISIEKGSEKMGASFVSTPTIKFDNCIVPKERLLSSNGFKDVFWCIDIARIFVSAIATGLAQEAIDQTIKYLGKRVQFKKPLISNQGIQWSLAELSTQVEAGRWMTYRAATLMDKGEPSIKAATMAKLYCTDLAMKVTTECCQLLGANGYSKDYPLERMMRVAKMLQIVDGTTQIQKVVLGRFIEREGIEF